MKMHRTTLWLFLVLCVACSREPDSIAIDQRAVTDGGTVKNANREKAEQYFAAFAEVKSAEEEKKLLTEFGQWLGAKGYRIRVEVKDGKHDLSCPYFPPVTPWTRHSFFEVENLELLPQLDDSGS